MDNVQRGAGDLCQSDGLSHRDSGSVRSICSHDDHPVHRYLRFQPLTAIKEVRCLIVGHAAITRSG